MSRTTSGVTHLGTDGGDARLRQSGPGTAAQSGPGTAAWDAARDAAGPSGRGATGVSVALLCVVAFLACWSRNQTALGAILLLAICLSGRIPRLRTPDVLALALASWAVLTLAWTPDLQVTLRTANLYVASCLVFLTVRHVVTTRLDLLAVAGCYLAGCLLRSAQLIREALSAGTSLGGDALDLSVRYGIDGFNINFTAYSLVTGFVLALVLADVRTMPRLARLALRATLPVLACAVVLSGTRAAVIALGLGSVCFLACRRATRLCWGGALLAVPALLILIPVELTRGNLAWLDTVFQNRATGDLSGRLLVWPYAMQSLSDSPLLGVGAGVFPVTNPAGFGAHNLVLTVGNDLGLIGLVVYGAVVVTALLAATRRSPRNHRRAVLFLVSLLPIWMTGHWDVALGMWLVLGVISVLPDDPAASPARGVEGADRLPGGHRDQETGVRPG